MVNDISFPASNFEITGYNHSNVAKAYIKSKKYFQEIHLFRYLKSYTEFTLYIFDNRIILGPNKKNLEDIYNKQYKDIDNELLKFALDNWDNIEKLCQVIN